MRLIIGFVMTALSMQGCADKGGDSTGEGGAEDSSGSGDGGMTGSGTEATGSEPTSGTATPDTGGATEGTDGTSGTEGISELPEVSSPCMGCSDGEHCEYWVSSLGCGTVWDCSTFDFFNDEDDSRMDDDCAPCLADPPACDPGFLDACVRNDDWICGGEPIISVGMTPEGAVVVECEAPAHDCGDEEF